MDDATRRDIEATCERLVIAFGRYRDLRDADAVADIVTEDCAWHRDGAVVAGREAIRTAVSQMTDELVLRHVMSNILVDVIDDNHATALAYYTVYLNRGSTGLPRPFSGPTRVGDYATRFVRTGGRWLLSYAASARVFEYDPNA